MSKYKLILQLPLYIDVDDEHAFEGVYEKTISLPFLPEPGQVIEYHLKHMSSDPSHFAYIDYVLQSPAWSEHRSAFIERRVPMVLANAEQASAFAEALEQINGWIKSPVDFDGFVDLDPSDPKMAALLTVYGVE